MFHPSVRPSCGEFRRFPRRYLGRLAGSSWKRSHSEQYVPTAMSDVTLAAIHWNVNVVNFQCSQWWKFCQNDNISISVLLGLLFWYPLSWLSLCNSFEDRVPVDEIDGRPFFIWVAVTLYLRYGTRRVVPVIVARVTYPIAILLVVKSWNTNVSVMASLNADWLRKCYYDKICFSKHKWLEFVDWTIRIV